MVSAAGCGAAVAARRASVTCGDMAHTSFLVYKHHTVSGCVTNPLRSSAEQACRGLASRVRRGWCGWRESRRPVPASAAVDLSTGDTLGPRLLPPPCRSRPGAGPVAVPCDCAGETPKPLVSRGKRPGAHASLPKTPLSSAVSSRPRAACRGRLKVAAATRRSRRAGMS